MNLLPNTEKDILKKGLKRRFAVVINILLAASFLIGVAMLLPAYFLTREHLVFINSFNSGAETKDEESIKEILDLPKEIEVKLKFFESNIANRSGMSSLSKVISYLPEKVALDSIVFSRSQGEKVKKGVNVVISGIAADRDSLVSFGAALKSSDAFSAVEMPVGSLTKEKNLPFSINIFMTD
ncbi:MAG: hypothetical protein UT61_C0054G0007 [Candidatus Woesebacteria bacterium GW2011_GWA1_39_8]|uniref:Uncharacterized protein n=1 Tax=Candidatus Woesebacteria bacterium GW2011_GWA1_39_8 TaxID=1618552 RepID=A0A0G0S0N8_9BACT|nr:MAG: hypothetical protein UT61_C0054G0007 [Candidatus Woesebacteria bacterium GW2011_GWA1_39_8]